MPDLIPFVDVPSGLVLAYPWMLALLSLIPVVITVRLLRNPEPAARFGAHLHLELVGRSARERLMWLPSALRCLTIAAIVVSLARPQLGVGEVRTVTNGVAIMAVIDRSFSMGDQMQYDGETLTRLDTVKRVFNEFVEGSPEKVTEDDALKGRTGDLIGLIKFAGIAETACPLVRVHSTLTDLALQITLATSAGGDPEAGTAIGDGLALAIARLESAENDLAQRGTDDELGEQARDPDFNITSKVIVLLTDGDENNTEIQATDAARLAADRGITIYTIGIGSSGGRYGFNPALLQFIANTTNGKYWPATDAQALRSIYNEINELEKTEVISTEYTSRNELFSYPLIVAGIAFMLEALLRTLVLRRATL